MTELSSDQLSKFQCFYNRGGSFCNYFGLTGDSRKPNLAEEDPDLLPSDEIEYEDTLNNNTDFDYWCKPAHNHRGDTVIEGNNVVVEAQRGCDRFKPGIKIGLLVYSREQLEAKVKKTTK